ncbi:hypothetical protein S40285_09216, partial [Stachybotrys chlorohalonatus IBT 40285]
MTQNQRSILITGCSQGGVGNALALEFHAKGFRVFATARSQTSLANLSERGINTMILDVTSPKSISDLKRDIAAQTGGKLDILFNNAGVLYEAPAIEAYPSRVRGLFDTNVFGLMEVVSAFAPLLLASVTANNKPIIINVASVLARLPSPFSSSYNASKAAVAAYSDTLRLELEPLGIDVRTLYMGEVSTPLMSTDNINFGPTSIYSATEGAVKARTETHLKQSMQPVEFARQVVKEVTGGKSSHIWKGTNAFVVWLLGAFAPRSIFDSAMIKAAGLNVEGVRADIFKRGRQMAINAKPDT